MTIIRRTSPRRDIATVRDVFDRFFEETPFRAWGNFAESRLPLDISSTEDAISIEAALPGIRPEDVEITVHQDTLTIGVKEQAERETREGERVYREVRRSSGLGDRASPTQRQQQLQLGVVETLGRRRVRFVVPLGADQPAAFVEEPHRDEPVLAPRDDQVTLEQPVECPEVVLVVGDRHRGGCARRSGAA